MPVRKDFLLDQLHEFFDALQQIAARLMERDLDKADEKIRELWHAQTIARLTTEGGDDASLAQEKPAFLRFQTELLLLRLQLEGARGRDTADLRRQAIIAVRKLIGLQPNVYDLELQQHLQNLQGVGDNGGPVA